MRTLFGFALLGFAVVLAGCNETVDSTNIKTPGIAATIVATADSDSSTRVIATLQVGGPSSNTYVNLEGGDQIFAINGTDRKAMLADGEGVYSATFGTAVENADFAVDLQRTVEADAPENKGTLPAPLALTVGASAVSRNADITFTWTPSGSKDAMTLKFNGSCIFGKTIDVPGDTGTFTAGAGTFEPTSTTMAETCDVTVDIERSRSGTTDPGFDSESTFMLHQKRSGTFTSTP
jgi:hypothetical protein